MADAVLSALATAILTNLTSLVRDVFSTVAGFRTEVEDFQRIFTTIQAVLLDAEGKQWKDVAVKDWLRKLKDAAYEAEDLLDEFATEAKRSRLPKDLRIRVRSFFSDQNPVVFRVKMALKLKSIKEKLDAIASKKQEFLLEGIGIRETGGILDRRETSSLVNESQVFGRNDEKEELVRMLLQANSDEPSVYAIYGMGGLGKTILAQLLYNDARVDEHFDLRIWVPVCVDFDLKRLIRTIIESIGGCSSTYLALGPLQQELQGKLRRKKFLLVLDDVWNEHSDKWEGLNNTIRCGATGSVVVVTTRNKNVALMMAADPIFHIERLSDADSSRLFEQRAFGLGRNEEFEHLKTIGRDIVKKCGGVPLAIKAMGSSLHLEREKSEWLRKVRFGVHRMKKTGFY